MDEKLNLGDVINQTEALDRLLKTNNRALLDKTLAAVKIAFFNFERRTTNNNLKEIRIEWKIFERYLKLELE